MEAGGTAVSIGDAIIKGTGVFSSHFSRLFGLALAGSLPASFAPLWLLDIPEGTPSVDQIWNALFPNAILMGIALLLLSVVSGGALVRALAGIVGGRPIGFGEAYGDGLAQIVPLAWSAILAGLLVGIGMLLLIVPGIYLGLCFAFIYPVVMLEAKSGGAALGRSRELARGNLLGILGLGALYGIIALGLGLPVALLIPDSQEVARAAASAAMNGLVAAWGSAVYVALYFAIRRSREPGFDPGAFSAPDVS